MNEDGGGRAAASRLRWLFAPTGAAIACMVLWAAAGPTPHALPRPGAPPAAAPPAAATQPAPPGESSAPAASAPPAPVPQAAVTSLWRDDPGDAARVRVDELPGIVEPSDLLLHGGELYTISDDHRQIYRLRFDGPDGAPRRAGSWTPRGLPAQVDLEALAPLPGGAVLLASETHGTLFVLSPFPDHACAAWSTGVDGRCFIGRPNCGVEAIAALPDNRLFVAKERDPRGAWLFDMPASPCQAVALAGRTYLTLPDDVGPDISAATYDAISGRLLVVARARQAVLEFKIPAASPGDTTPRPLKLLGKFSYARTEDSLDYAGLDFHQVEGIAVDEARTLHLSLDNNGRLSRRFGNRRAALLRFFAVR